MKYGYTALIPFGEGRRYDMVIEKDAQFFRLLSVKQGVMIMGLSSSIRTALTGGIGQRGNIHARKSTISRSTANIRGKSTLCRSKM
jgi:PD-(D/E)XK endonuclease